MQYTTTNISPHTAPLCFEIHNAHYMAPVLAFLFNYTSLIPQGYGS